MANQQIAVGVVLARTKLDVVPFEGHQFHKTQAGADRSKEERVTPRADFIGCFKEVPRLLASQKFNLATASSCQIELSDP